MGDFVPAVSSAVELVVAQFVLAPWSAVDAVLEQAGNLAGVRFDYTLDRRSEELPGTAAADGVAAAAAETGEHGEQNLEAACLVKAQLDSVVARSDTELAGL